VSGADPILSVVVPTRGRPRYLERCLEALAAADYPRERFEVVVVNDGGSEEVQRVVSSTPGGLRTSLVVPVSSGPSSARNAGAGAAAGRFLAFTDDDCEPAPGWLAALENALTADGEVAVGGRTLNGAPANTGAASSQMVVDAVHAHFNRDPEAPTFFASYNLAFPAQAFHAVGGFNENFRYAEDRELCERWILAGHRFAHAPDALVHHMRTLTLREFLAQHYGYGRGAWVFHRGHGAGAVADLQGVLRALVDEWRGAAGGNGRAAVAAYLALSQAATAVGFTREAVARRVSSQPAGSTPANQ
jgi:glycosyltransferase involved in cell wall biosynthesis